MAIACDALCTIRRMSSSGPGPGGVPRTGRPRARARLMVARAKEAGPAPVASELLGPTEPVIWHHVKILVDAGSLASREALRVGVLLTCPLSLGALAAAAGMRCTSVPGVRLCGCRA